MGGTVEFALLDGKKRRVLVAMHAPPSAILLCALIGLLAAGCGGDATSGPVQAVAVATIHQAASTNGTACGAAADCTSGFCDNTGQCAACTADGNCTQGTIGASGGQYCSNTGVCTARKADGALCNTTSQCSGAGCYAARQCINGCCDGLNVCHGYATGDNLCLSGRRCDDGNPCHTGGTVSTTANPHVCTGFANLANGSSCSPDTATCTADACSSGSCTHPAGNAGVACHIAGGECDTATTCSGSSATCPSGLKASGTACTADTNPCTLDQCDGATATCQHPAGNAGNVCRAANGACDVAETCTGSSTSCPADGVASMVTVCRASTGTCDPAETCTGPAGYAQTITLTNPSGGAAQTDFQVRLEILGDNVAFWSHIDGGASATGHDIHVQDAGGNELSFWIEQLDTTAERAWIWVRVPSIAAPPSTSSLTLLYGNATRVASSSIDATMIFGDEFTGSGTGTSVSGLDGSKWVVDDVTGWAVTGATGGHLTSTNVGGRIHSTTPVTTGTVLEAKWNITTNTDLAYVVVDGVKNTGSTNGDALVAGLDLDDGHQFNYWNNNLWTDTFNWSANYTASFARSSIAIVGTASNSNTSTLTVWADASNQRTLTFNQAYSPSSAALTLGKPYDDVSDHTGTYTADWDWALIRKYAATPPTLIANNDESADAASHSCPADITSCGAPTNTVLTPAQLPPPPDVRGCYVGTWNGWVAVPCSPYDQLPAFIQQKLYIGGGQVTIPGYLDSGSDGGAMSYGPIPGISSSSGLKFGQVETTFVDVAVDSSGYTETNVPPQSSPISGCNGTPSTPVSLSIQANTNNFPAVTGDAADNGDQAWVQFAIQYQGVTTQYGATGFNICIWNNDFTLGKEDKTSIPDPSAPSCTTSPCEKPRLCVSGQCRAPPYWPDCLATTNYAKDVGTYEFNLAVQGRPLQALDYASVAGSAFTDANDGGADLGLVAAMSWFDPSNNNNDYRGLYAVVTQDRYGLGASNNWTTVSGTVLGLGNCGTATFPQGTMVYTSVQAGNCATQGTPPPPYTVTWPGVCPNTLGVSSTPEPAESTESMTDESNNLNIIAGSQSALANATDGNNYLQMHYLASVDGNCVSTPRVYVKDHPQDRGSTPSNLGGEAFWESPDIIVVPPNTAVTADTPAGDPIVIAGNNYDIYVRVHNDFACGPIGDVRARVWWGNAALAMPLWTDVITNGPDPGNPNWSQSKSLPFGDSLDIIGPIPWIAPSNVTPHECLLVDVQADGEGAPTDTADAPDSYQVAQRNIEIGGACGWVLTNGTQSSQLGVTLTATDGNGQPYVIASGDSAAVTFDDQNQTLFNGWNGNAHPGCTLSHDNGPGTTIVTMNVGAGQATLQGAPIAATASLNVTSTVVPALYSGTTINLRIATFLTSGGTISGSPTNGSSCSATAQTAPH